jgi:hypothetical protein
MGNFSNEIENTKDYLGDNTPMFTKLLDLPDRQEGQDLMTHLRMLYGHVDWQNMIVKMDQPTIDLLKKNADRFGIEDDLGKLREGRHIALLNSNMLEPVTYIELKTGAVNIDLVDLEEAIEQAAFWLMEEYLDCMFSFGLFTPYFLLAYRLALMEGWMDDDERFSDKRQEQVWQDTFSEVIVCAFSKLMRDLVKGDKTYLYAPFHLKEYAVEDYLENM